MIANNGKKEEKWSRAMLIKWSNRRPQMLFDLRHVRNEAISWSSSTHLMELISHHHGDRLDCHNRNFAKRSVAVKTRVPGDLLFTPSNYFQLTSPERNPRRVENPSLRSPLRFEKYEMQFPESDLTCCSSRSAFLLFTEHTRHEQSFA